MGSLVLNKSKKKGHAVCIPYPAQGHISPMLKLSKLLHSHGFHITFVNTLYNHHRLVASRGPESIQGATSFQFEAIPDGLIPPSDKDSINATQDIPTLSNSIHKTGAGPFRDLLRRLDASPDVPGVTCVISDGAMSFTLDVAEEFGVPEVVFFTTSACGFLAYVYYEELVKRGYVPFKDDGCFTNGYLDTTIDWIPGLEGIRLRDLPTFIRTTDPNAIMLNFSIEQLRNVSRAKAILLNTFEDLEEKVLKAIRSCFRLVLTIGPLQLISNEITPCSTITTKDGHEHELVSSIGCNLWREDHECINWLDKREPKSVVYVNFGSITVMTQEQLSEFAWGLANSGDYFLWIIRPDLVSNGPILLPKEFILETKERAMLTNWCAQEKVLSHPSLGVFLTHSGWNSTIESVGEGVPMICWPFFAEQQTNCKFVCSDWANGIEIESDVRRDVVERKIREMMEGERGKVLREKALEWREKARVAVKPGGSSYINFNYLINELLLDNSNSYCTANN
ncbi:hypothetical protein Scep_018521 [Stephania cephalantha]|uniref:Glycosyltransferase n=1 Tax=Stephania cephalantha TaxID=152367 RepID=A0AAP0I951_9MAGN